MLNLILPGYYLSFCFAGDRSFSLSRVGSGQSRCFCHHGYPFSWGLSCMIEKISLFSSLWFHNTFCHAIQHCLSPSSTLRNAVPFSLQPLQVNITAQKSTTEEKRFIRELIDMNYGIAILGQSLFLLILIFRNETKNHFHFNIILHHFCSL